MRIHRFADSFDGMPAVEVWEYDDGGLVIADGVMRATRAALLRLGETIAAVVILCRPGPSPNRPRIGETLP